MSESFEDKMARLKAMQSGGKTQTKEEPKQKRKKALFAEVASGKETAVAEITDVQETEIFQILSVRPKTS